MDVVERVADVLERLPVRGAPGSELDALRRREAARAAIAEVFEWQPIETAPKDETRFLAYLGENDGVWMISWRIPYGDETRAAWALVCTEDWEAQEYPISPTHWMPLPAPPSRPNPCAEGGE